MPFYEFQAHPKRRGSPGTVCINDVTLTTIGPAEAAVDNDDDGGVGGTAAAEISGMTSNSFYSPTVLSIEMASAAT